MNYINGIYSTNDRATISAHDLGFLRGFGIFEFFRTYQKRPFFLHTRLERLEGTAQAIGIPFHHTFKEIEEIIDKLITHAPWEELTVRIIATGGESADGLTPSKEGSLILLTAPVPPPSSPIELITCETTRSLPKYKTLDYLSALIAKQKAQAAGAGDALFCTKDGAMLEATTANFFAIKKGVLITPSEEILRGITRQVILDHLWSGPIEYRPIYRNETLDEAFLSSSIREIVPIASIDGQALTTHTQTEKLLDTFHTFTCRELLAEKVVDRLP